VHNLGLPSFQALEAYNTSSYTSSGFIDTWTVKRPWLPAQKNPKSLGLAAKGLVTWGPCPHSVIIKTLLNAAKFDLEYLQSKRIALEHAQVQAPSKVSEQIIAVSTAWAYTTFQA
jgi:hypothetical protein